MTTIGRARRNRILLEESAFLAAAGESWYWIAARLGVRVQSLHRAYRRAGWDAPPDLIRAAEAERSEMERRRAAA